MNKKKKISLIAINPDALQNTSIALLEAYALKDSHLLEKIVVKRFYFDALVPSQSNAIDLYIRQLLDFDGDIIGFSSYCWNIEIIIKMITEIKRIHSSVTIFLGGTEATGSSFELLSRHKEIDYIISGEGEVAFYEFLMFSVGMTDIDEVSNLYN